MKNINKILTIVLGIILIATTIFTAKSFITTSSLNNKIDFDEHVVNIKEKKKSETTKEEKNPESKESNIVIKSSKDGFINNNSILLINGDSKITVNIEGNHSIQYDQSLSEIIVDNRAYIQNINSSKITVESTSTFIDSENNIIVSGQKIIDKNSAVSVIVKSNEENKEKDIEFVNSILNNTYLYNNTQNITIDNMKINNEWNNIVMDNNVISLSNGTDTVYFSIYAKQITGAGFDKELKISDSITLKYSDIKDESSGYIPYIIQNDNYVLKILAKSNDIITDIFS